MMFNDQILYTISLTISAERVKYPLLRFIESHALYQFHHPLTIPILYQFHLSKQNDMNHAAPHHSLKNKPLPHLTPQ